MTGLRSVFAAVALLAPAVALAIDPTAAKPPVAKVDPHKTKLHGDERTDNYFWLKDKKNPEVIKYLDAENAYTTVVMRTTEELQSNL